MCRSLYRGLYFHEITANSVIELSISTKCLKVEGKSNDCVMAFLYSYNIIIFVPLRSIYKSLNNKITYVHLHIAFQRNCHILQTI